MSVWDLAVVLGRHAALAAAEQRPASVVRLQPANDAEPDAPPWPPFDGPVDLPVVGWAAALKVFGDPELRPGPGSTLRASPAWERANMVIARDLPGYPRPIYCHRLAEPYLREALRRADRVGARVERIGCFNPRRQRHDPNAPPSDHALGIAFDCDPSRNRGVYRKRGAKPSDPWARPGRPGYVPRPFEEGWEQFSSLPAAFVEAFKSVGFEWGGDWNTFVDPMHLSLRRTR